MLTSIFIAKILAIVYVVLGFGVMVNSDYYSKLGKDYAKNSGLVMIWGLLALVLGSVIVLIHNKWNADWTVLITIFGWLALIEGILIAVFTKPILALVKSLVDKKLMMVWGFLAIIIGLIFGYFGFFI